MAPEAAETGMTSTGGNAMVPLCSTGRSVSEKKGPDTDQRYATHQGGLTTMHSTVATPAKPGSLPPANHTPAASSTTEPESTPLDTVPLAVD